MIRREVFKKEQEIVSRNLGSELSKIPDLPDWIKDKDIQYWEKLLFSVHYLPKISLDEGLDIPLWKDKKDRPYKVFYKKIREGKIEKKAKTLTGKWILIDSRDKPSQKVPWMTSDEVWFLKKIGFEPKNYFKKWKRQIHKEEYLKEILKEKGFGSRFCLSINDIDSLKPFISSFLKVDFRKNIRLPFFAEYNYLANAVYSQWQTTKTWEWFQDKFEEKQHLAGGSKSPGCVGWEPRDFWSTILTFRPVVEL